MAKPKRTLEESFKIFFEKCIPEPNSGCWLWITPTVSYPGFNHMHAHVWAFIHFKYQPKRSRNWCIRHTCDNPYCVNPDHLVRGNARQNARDCIKRNRHLPRIAGMLAWQERRRLEKVPISPIINIDGSFPFIKKPRRKHAD